MDLLSNFMGLIVIGGGGLMLLVGGAVVHSKVGPASFARRCQAGYQAQRGDLELNLDRDGRKVSRRVETCSMEGRNSKVVFNIGEPDADRQRDIIQRSTCLDLFNAVNFIKANDIKNGVVEIVGRASDDYADTAKCGSNSPDLARMLYLADERRASDCEGCTPEVRDAVRRLLLSVPSPSQGSPRPLDRALCNSPLAMKRAVSVQKLCYIWGLGPNGPKDAPSEDDLISRVTVTSDPTRDEALCDGSGEDCMRTVSVRVRLPNYSPPGLPRPPATVAAR